MRDKRRTLQNYIKVNKKQSIGNKTDIIIYKESPRKV